MIDKNCLDKYEKIFMENNYYGKMDENPLNIFYKSFGEKQILISAPHATRQIRNNKEKLQEYSTGSTAIYLAENIECDIITKYKTFIGKE